MREVDFRVEGRKGKVERRANTSKDVKREDEEQG